MDANYEVLPSYRRFNQKNNAIMRSAWDPALNFYGERSKQAISDHIKNKVMIKLRICRSSG